MDVVVTGIGPLLPNCTDRSVLWSQLRDGPSQLTFEAAPAPASPGEQWPVGRIHGFDAGRWLGRFPGRYHERYHREQQLYLASLVIALDDAGLDLAAVQRERVGLFDGTSRGNFDYWYERVREEQHVAPAAGLAASLLGVRGPVQTVSATGCSGAVAIGHALRELRDGDLDVALASGHDSSLRAPLYHMYRDAGLLSAERIDARRAVRPF